ncbi:hypothetical protein [Woodsholea maritima]|uniref:hypothetical protein n=1 Tax=Woodsholea maritima TaxID=240237 RepID=UPI00036DDCE5|nr:hypothetical protein [Woodsholea maritima]
MYDTASRQDTWPQLCVRWAEIAAGVGDVDRALEYLNQAVDLGWRDKDFLRHSPYLGPVRASAQWAEVMARIERELLMQSKHLTSSGVMDDLADPRRLEAENEL